MSIDPYSSCPCGSGKSFKWCCQSFYGTVERAVEQFQQGQRDVALRTIDQLIAQHPDRPQVWGYKAQLLYQSERFDEADEALQKAFSLQADYPYGHFLRGMIRLGEGEGLGALIEFRKAAELYDPKANELLGEILERIAELELQMNRPVAGRAALERALHLNPADAEARQIFENLFGPVSRLPQAAKRAYSFRSAAPERAAAWRATLDSATSGRLTEAVRGFEQLTESDPNDAAAWFNLGLARAWLGDNPRAVEALERSIDLESDDGRAEEAGALTEVLRCGQGMADLSDYQLHWQFFRVANPQAVIKALEEWGQKQRLVGVHPDQESGSLSAIVLEETPNFGLGVGTPVSRAQAHLFVVGDQLQLWHTDPDRVGKVAKEVRDRAGPAVSDPISRVTAAGFGDVVLEALSFPNQPAPADTVRAKMAEQAAQFFEERWLNRSLKSLSGLTPLDAAASPVYRKRLRGVIRFLADCLTGNAPILEEGDEKRPMAIYDFDRLRRKLGLLGAAPAERSSDRNISAMSVEELAGLNAGALSDEELSQAFRSALQLGADELAGAFARQATQRRASPGTADRYPFYSHLIQLAQAENDSNRVVELLDAAEKSDAELNEGRRQSDYALRRGQTYAKRGDAHKAHEVFRGLIERQPGELRNYGAAAETMLGQKRGQWALQFAEQGLAKARSQNNRDSEQYFLELVGAAKRLGG
jgi:tetratricopeptide (TPR) repeat protein